MTRALIALGTNMGDRQGNLAAAVDALRFIGNVKGVSSVIETAPVGYADQPDFLNAVLELEWTRDAGALMAELKRIELEIGRTKTFRNGPREIDLDLLLFGSETHEGAELTVPHPRMHERRFVLEPLVEIAPDAYHPHFQATARELLRQLVEREGATRAGKK